MSPNILGVCEVCNGLGERKRTAYPLLSEGVSPEATVRERRVGRSVSVARYASVIRYEPVGRGQGSEATEESDEGG